MYCVKVLNIINVDYVVKGLVCRPPPLQAFQAKMSGIYIFAVVVTPVGVVTGLQEFEQIANSSGAVIQLNSYSQLQSKLNLLLQLTCLPPLEPDMRTFSSMRLVLRYAPCSQVCARCGVSVHCQECSFFLESM